MKSENELKEPNTGSESGSGEIVKAVFSHGAKIGVNRQGGSMTIFERS